MSNFTRSGGRAKIWQSITNLSCCSIDLVTRRSISMKALAFFMLFAFSINSIYAQQERSTFISGCLSDVPSGFTEAEVALLYGEQCGDLTPNVSKTILVEGNDCEWTSVITYFIKCGTLDTQFKVEYYGGDDSAPLLNDGAEVPTGGQGLDLCISDVPNGPSEFDIAALYSDNCSEVLVTKSGTPTGSDCEWSVTYSYTVKDVCENMASTLNVTYSGGDTQAPQLTKGATIPTGELGLNSCFSDKTQGPTEEDIASLFSDNCGTVNVTKLEQSKGTDCKWVAVYTYTIQDDCGNFAESIVLNYSGADLEPPVLSGVPDDITVNCIDEIPSPTKGEVSALDNCSSDVIPFATDDISGLAGACLGGVVIRTYTATDNCDRSVSETQTITVLPTPESTLTTGWFLSNISCDDVANFSAADATYSNGVAEGACSVSGSIEAEVIIDYTECGGTITVTYDGVDSCDRPLSAGPFIIAVDPAPIAVFNPIVDIAISCDVANQYIVDSLDYTNGASNEACLIAGEVDGELSGSYTECGGTLYVDWTYTDSCGRTIEARKTITVSPAPMAAFDEVEDMTISCDEAGSFTASSLSYTNGASNEVCLIAGDVDGELSGSYTECGGTLTVDWTYTDNCERTITAKKTITVEPAPMAAFDEVDDMTISCEEAGSFTADSLSYTNGASNEACLIAGDVDGELSGEYTECGGTLTVSWTYTDDCERTIEASKTITVLPAPMAAFDDVEDMTISCDEAGLFTAGSLSYTNGASNEACLIAGDVDGELSGSYTECGGTLVVDWTYTDECDRTITAKKMITVEPAPMAAFGELDHMTISCEEAGLLTADYLSYTNGASNEACLIAGEVEGELSGEYNECGGLLFVDWTYTDDCERTITARQQFKVNPATMAEFDDAEDMEITCEEANVFEAGSLGYTNGAINQACLIAGDVDGELSGSYTECGGTLTVNWTYTDDCERTIEASQTITVLPAPMAEFDDVENISITCEAANQYLASPLGYTNGGTGVCEISGSVPGQLSGDYTECGGTLIVDWTYTDNCERTITAKKTITVEPAPMAAFDHVDDMTISCEEAGSFTAGSLGYTNGASNEACLIAGDVDGELSGDYTECGGTLYVDWTYTDNCGRTIEARKTITVSPAPMAAFDEVDDMTISCEEAGTFVAGSLSYTNGASNEACLIAGDVDGELSGSYTECGGTLVVDWTYTDDCERTITAKKTITVEPAPMAAFEPVENMTVSCEEAEDFTANYLVEGFEGDFAPGNWTIDLDGSDGNVSIDATTMVVTGADENDGDFTNSSIVTATATCPESGTYSFDWAYSSTDDPGYDSGFYVNGELVEFLSSTDGESGSVTVTCVAGDVIGFGVQTDDGEFGAGNLAITNFSVGSANMLSYTNGGTEACEISGAVPGLLSGAYDECGGTLYIDWSYTDDCGRTITAQKVITVEPAPEAEFETVEDMTISCEEAAAIVSSTLVEDFTNPAEIYGFEGLSSAAVTADPQDGNNQVLELISTDAGQPWQGAGLVNNIDFTNTKSMKIDVLADQAFDLLVKVENTPSDFAETGVSYTNVGQWQTLTVSFDQPVNGVATDQVYPILALFPNWNIGDNGWNQLPGNFAVYVDNIVVGGPGCLSYTNGGTGACEISGSVPGEVTGTYDECGGILEVDWTYTDDCERTITAKKTITVEPAPMAAFEPVENMTVSCEEAEDFTANYLVEGFEGDFAPGNWTIDVGTTDGSVNITETEMTIVGSDNGSNDTVIATATCPESGTYSFDWAYSSTDSPGFDSGFYVNGELALSLGNTNGDSGSVSVNCVAGDVIGFAVTTVDGIVGAGNLAITNFSVGSANMLSYTNGGTEACEISGAVPGLLSGAYDECGGTLYIDWSYTDDCGRTITAQKVITVEPAPTAEFATIMDASIYCEDLATYEPEFLSYTNGGTGACEISGSVQGVADVFDGSCGTFEVNFTFTDACGRPITSSQTITVIDETAPVLTGELPQGESNLDLCFDTRPEGPTEAEIAALFTDCGNVNVTKTQSAPQEDDCSWAVMYRYEIQDDCGNFANPVKVFYNGGDQSAPLLTGTLPEGSTGLQCLSDNPGAPSLDALNAAYTDNCGTVTITPLEPVITGDDCSWTATYGYTVVDACDNYAANIVIVNSGADTMAPVLEGEIPMGENTLDLCIDSDLEEPSEEYIASLYGDNCSEVTVTKIEKTYGTDCEWIRVFEYIAEDACGNKSDVIKVNYAGGDATAPVFDQECQIDSVYGTMEGAICPNDAEISLDINQEIDVYTGWTVGGIEIDSLAGCVSDTCASDEDLVIRVKNKTKVGDDCSQTLTITFVAVDACGNESEDFVCNYTIIDDTAPVVECPEGQDYGIVTEAPTGFADKATYTDNCQADGETQDYTDVLTSVITEGNDCASQFENRLLTSEADFSGAETFINFDENDNSNFLTPSDGSEYTAQGVTFSSPSALFITNFGNPQFGNSGDMTYIKAESGNDTPLVLDFTTPINRLGLYLATNDSDDVSISVQCFMNNSELGTEFVITDQYSSFFGLESAAAFDRVVLTAVGGSNDIIVIDDLRFEGCEDIPTTEDFTLVRTFTANDGCDNTSTCDVVYTWTVVLTPENDECVDATPIACGDSIMGSTDYASQESDLPSCDNSLDSAPGVWYVLEGTGDILDVTADTFGSDYDTKLGVFSGSCDALTCVTSNDDAGSLQSEVSFISEVGVDYYIYVTGFATASGEYMLTVACEVLTVCDVADELACGDVVSGNTTSGTPEFVDQPCTSIGSNIGDWYAFVGTGDDVVFSTCSANTTYDTFLSAYTDCGETCEVGNDDAACTHSNVHSSITVSTVVDQVYNIYVSGFNGGTGAYDLSVACGLATIVDCDGPGETIDVNNYSNNELLEWAYTSSTGDPLTVDFSGSTEGGYDDITVYDGLDDTAPVLGVFSGSLSGLMVASTGDSLFIVFDSDGSVSGFSFDVNVECSFATIVDCDGPGETIDVNNYSNNELLEWAYTSSTGDPLTVDFSGSTEGWYDDITVYDGLDDTAPVLGVFSGSLSGLMVTSTGDSLFIVFDSDGSVSGFSFDVNVECGYGELRQAEEDVKIDFTAYPVPFDNEVNIAYSFEFETNVTIELFDTKGLQVFSDTNKNYVTGSNGTSTFDLSRYSSQMFYVKLTTSQGTVTKKIVSSGKK